MRIRSVLALAMLLVTASCSADVQSLIIGEWKETSGGVSAQQLEFAPDGAFRGVLTLGLRHMTMPVGGSYSVKGNTVRINLRSNGETVWKVEPGGNDSITVTVESSGLLSCDDNSTLKFKRTK